MHKHGAALKIHCLLPCGSPSLWGRTLDSQRLQGRVETSQTWLNSMMSICNKKNTYAHRIEYMWHLLGFQPMRICFQLSNRFKLRTSGCFGQDWFKFSWFISAFLRGAWVIPSATNRAPLADLTANGYRENHPNNGQHFWYWISSHSSYLPRYVPEIIWP